MKLLRLEINNIRGIPHLVLEPNGRNLVIWGQNGSGKSAVVDAIDFLITGGISRLRGKGAGELSLAKHGPHIGNQPEEATVSAILQLPGIKKPVEIKRCIADPDKPQLKCEDRDQALAGFLLLKASRGQLVLARREILKYIYSEPGDRAEQIQDLLSLSYIEAIRSTLVKVKHKAEGERKASQSALDAAKAIITTTIGTKVFSQSDMVKFANANRITLEGYPLTEVSVENLLSGTRKPADSLIEGINKSVLEKNFACLDEALSEKSAGLNKADDSNLRQCIGEIRANPNSLKLCSRLGLVEQGIKLIDERGNCPLCDTQWESGKLEEYLLEKITRCKAYADKNRQIDGMSSSLLVRLEKTLASVRELILALDKLCLTESRQPLESWQTNLEEMKVLLKSALEKYPGSKYDSKSVIRMVAPDGSEDAIRRIRGLLKDKIPEATPELNAWSALIKLGENLKVLIAASAELRKSELYEKRATNLLNDYIGARDSVLTSLYNTIADRFGGLYRQLHGEDEGGFTAKLEPKGAGLSLEVDFYGKGSHPPQALHSEGHQDSMGICLYLALTERLNRDLINLVILDDVVMSVDIDHRKQICGLVRDSFPDKQFIITTHDRTWAMQLRNQKVVTSNQLIEFHNWDLSTGPQVNVAEILWDSISEELQKDNIHNAAGELRRGLEAFFSEVCDNVAAMVPYRANYKWELGDWCPAAIARYRELLKKAKIAAQSWGDDETLARLEETEEISDGLIEASQAEQWHINLALHYNGWENFTTKEFMPVVEAFHDLTNLFLCDSCAEKLFLTYDGYTPINLRCGCGQENWNLAKKKTI